MPLIDVLVCSYNESKSIPDLLESLKKQTTSLDEFNIIFVDNASDDNTREIIENFQKELENLQYIFEPNKGKSFALNTGYGIATSEYVAHIDADCKADKKWIENIINLANEEHPSLFGGGYLPYYNSPKPKWFKDKYNTDWREDKRIVLSEGYLNGCNMIWRRDLVLSLGGHNIELGINEHSLAGGEDTELIARARQKYTNIKIIYDQSIFVYHLTKEKQFNLWYFFRRTFITGRRLAIIFRDTENLVIWKIILKTGLAILWIMHNIVKGITFKDKKSYPYYENYLYEVVIPKFGNLGQYYELLINSNLS